MIQTKRFQKKIRAGVDRAIPEPEFFVDPLGMKHINQIRREKIVVRKTPDCDFWFKKKKIFLKIAINRLKTSLSNTNSVKSCTTLNLTI